jgi:transposase
MEALRSKKRTRQQVFKYDDVLLGDDALGSKRWKEASEALQWLSSQMLARETRRRMSRRPRAPVEKHIPKPHHSLYLKREVIKRAFGVYGGHRRNNVGYRSIARSLRLAPSTAQTIIRYYQRDGHRLKEHPQRGTRKRPRKLPPRVAKAITSKAYLEEHAHLSLVARCQQLFEEHQIRITPTTLRRIYREHKIRY